MNNKALTSIREVIGALPSDASNDAVGAHVAKGEEFFAPTTHAAALDISTPIVVGSRGTGKSFWASALAQDTTRSLISKAYPKLGVQNLQVSFGYTGIGGSGGLSSDAVDTSVPSGSSIEVARNFWWATVLRGLDLAIGEKSLPLASYISNASNWELRERHLDLKEKALSKNPGSPVVIIYDALDTISHSWPRRRILTEALLDVVWKMRAYRFIKLKIFFRPDQIDDEALKYVELPKLRTGAVRLDWIREDLYGMLFSRIISSKGPGQKGFRALLQELGIAVATPTAIAKRDWSLLHNSQEQAAVMTALAGPFMGSGKNGFKKGKTYDWPITHLADAFEEVTPRSFLIMMQSAASFGPPPDGVSLTPDGIRHGLRAASKMRVDQLHNESPWIKGVMAPLAGLLLPMDASLVHKAWKIARTIPLVKQDAEKFKYLPPFDSDKPTEHDLFNAMEKIGVMFQRKDQRLDMPDLYRVAARLLKKGATAPLR